MVLSWSRDYSVFTSVGSSFGISYGYGKGGVGPSTTHISSYKVDCCLNGSAFVSYLSIDYSSMIHSKKYGYYSSLSQKIDNQFIDAGGVRGGVGPITTYFSSQKVDLIIDSFYGWFWSYPHHHISYHMDSS